MALIKPLVKYDVLFRTRSNSKITQETRHTFVADPRQTRIRTDLIKLEDCAKLAQELTSSIESVQINKKHQKNESLINSLNQFSLSKYSEMLRESVLEETRLHFKLLNESDEKQGTIEKESLKDFENSQIEQLIDSRYDTASMTDLAVIEYKKTLAS